MFNKLGTLIRSLLTAQNPTGETSPLQLTDDGYLKVSMTEYQTIVNDGYRNFHNMDDTPSSYTGQQDKIIAVNPTENGLIFQDALTAETFIDNNDTPSTYNYKGTKSVVVNLAEDALIFDSLTESHISDLDHSATKIQSIPIAAPEMEDDGHAICYDAPTTSFVYMPIDDSGTGDMLKIMYDTDFNGIVDAAEAVPWSGITDAPVEFPPEGHTHVEIEITDLSHDATLIQGVEIDPPVTSGHYPSYNGVKIAWDELTPGTGEGDMLKSVYDTNDDGTVDEAAAVPWSGVTDPPDTYPPTEHTHTESIHKDVPQEIHQVVEKITPISTDLLLIEDSSDVYNKKRVQVGNLPAGSGGTSLAVEEVDGSPTVSNVSKIRVTNGDLIDEGGGVVRIKTAADASGGGSVGSMLYLYNNFH